MDSYHIACVHFLSMMLVGVIFSPIWFGSLNGEGSDLPLRLDMQRRQTRDQRVGSLKERKLELLQDAIRTSIARAHALASTSTTSGRSSKTKSPLGESYNLPLTSNRGAYVIDIELGSPPKIQEVVLDTGSDLVWIQCEPCIQCFPQKYGIFDPNASSSFEKQQCSTSLCQALPNHLCGDYQSCIYDYRYGDQSQTTGNLVTDILTLSNNSGHKIVFGCGYKNAFTSGQNQPGPSGIVGMGRGPLSLVEQLYNQFGGMFSYCLVEWNSPSSIHSPLVLGSENIPYGTQFTPILVNGPQPTFYYVGLEGISIDGKELPISPDVFEYTSSGAGTIFDSGTTLTFLPTNAQTEVKKAIASYVSSTPIGMPPKGFDLCYTGKQKYPDMVFHFTGNANMKVPNENYMVEVDSQGTSCLITTGNFDLGITIIGNLQQQNMHIFYDLSNSRIGFVPTNCKSL